MPDIENEINRLNELIRQQIERMGTPRCFVNTEIRRAYEQAFRDTLIYGAPLGTYWYNEEEQVQKISKAKKRNLPEWW